jgi:uncharacterized membrane protein
MKKINIAIILVIILSFGISAYLYPIMPDSMASHWGASGEVNGYMPKFWALFLMPMISVAMLALFLVLPMIDPKKSNIDKFRGYFDWFILLIIMFMFYVHLITLSWNLGMRFNMIQLLAPAFAVIFYYAGVLMSKAKMNWFIGMRTPWAMSSETVWDKTNKLGGKLFKIAGVLCLVAVLFERYAIIFLIVPVLIFSVYTFIYSYVEYNKEQKSKAGKSKKQQKK